MTLIKRIIAVLPLFSSLIAGAQYLTDTTAVTIPTADTLLVSRNAVIDSTLADKTIFEILPNRVKGDPATVTVHQSPALFYAFKRHFEASTFGTVPGYRVRIYFSNERNAREASLTAAWKFKRLFPEYNVYRIFATPNFKVTAGDFRSESEAMAMLEKIRPLFPAAFTVKEDINITD